jgi:hypothetical protein
MGAMRPQQNGQPIIKSSLASPVPEGRMGWRSLAVRPFWAFVSGWSVMCGALASNHVLWNGEGLLSLALVLILVILGWGSLWNLVTDTGWVQPAGRDRSRMCRPVLPAPPFTRPSSPAGQLLRALDTLVGWWRGVLWPAAGKALTSAFLCTLLLVALSVLLPVRLVWLHVAFAVLVGLGAWMRRRSAAPLAGQSGVALGLGWMAGYVVFAGFGAPSLALALLYSGAAWGVLRMQAGRAGGLWLSAGTQAIAGAILVSLEKPLAAGALALLLLGQIALPLSSRDGSEAALAARRTWPWLLAAMLVAAWALP